MAKIAAACLAQRAVARLPIHDDGSFQGKTRFGEKFRIIPFRFPPSASGSLESLQIGAFPFASAGPDEYPIGIDHRAHFPVMIVCSCNVLSDHDVRAAVTAASDTVRTAKEVYGCLGCSAECGRCARTIKQIMSEALTGVLSGALAEAAAPCAAAGCPGCPHSHHDAATVSAEATVSSSHHHADISITA